MGLNIRHFIGIMTIVSASALFFLQPYHVTIIEKHGVPQVAFFDFTTYEIEKSGVSAIVVGSRAERFGKKSVIQNPELRRVAEKGTETVRAKRAILTDNRGIELKKDVLLSRSDGWTMRTARLYYDIPKKLYTTFDAPFVITFGRSVVHGRALRYDQKSGKIKARSIRAKIVDEDI